MTLPEPTIEQRHAATLAQATGLRRAVLELHRPIRDWANDPEPGCEGCDAGAYAESYAHWPCSTYELARDWDD